MTEDSGIYLPEGRDIQRINAKNLLTICVRNHSSRCEALQHSKVPIVKVKDIIVSAFNVHLKSVRLSFGALSDTNNTSVRIQVGSGLFKLDDIFYGEREVIPTGEETRR